MELEFELVAAACLALCHLPEEWQPSCLLLVEDLLVSKVLLVVEVLSQTSNSRQDLGPPRHN